MERRYMHYIRNSICIHANHVREYQSQPWNKFLSLRSLQRSLIQTATLCEYTPRCQFTPKNLYLKKERSEKKSGHAIVSRIHQLVSGEPVKWSAVPPPLMKDGYTFYHNVAKISWIVFINIDTGRLWLVSGARCACSNRSSTSPMWRYYVSSTERQSRLQLTLL